MEKTQAQNWKLVMPTAEDARFLERALALFGIKPVRSGARTVTLAQPDYRRAVALELVEMEAK